MKVLNNFIEPFVARAIGLSAAHIEAKENLGK